MSSLWDPPFDTSHVTDIESETKMVGGGMRTTHAYLLSFYDRDEVDTFVSSLQSLANPSLVWTVWQNSSGTYGVRVHWVEPATVKERTLAAHASRARRIEINPNLRLGPVLTVAGFEDADGECIPGTAVEVHEYVSGMVGNGVIESVDMEACYVYIAVDWESITIRGENHDD